MAAIQTVVNSYSQLKMVEPAFTISPSKSLISPLIQSSRQMNFVLNVPSTAIPLKSPTISCFHPKFPKPVRTTSTAASFRISTLPARDRVIDFGKYKGKMLGSLPSNYLKWISKNLRAGDTEEWAKLADEVLSDPVYRDRIEWEFAEKILSGNAASHSSSGNGRDAVSELLEISEKFGWDNEDKGGWSRIDFGLLGTSKGGRIPRVAPEETHVELGNLKKKEQLQVEEISEEEGRRRRERRERVRRRKVKTSSMREELNDQRQDEGNSDQVVARNPFPGRDALLKKILNRERL